MFFEKHGQYVIIALALYCIFIGVRTLLTGKTSAQEEAKISNFTEKAAKRYRLVSALLNIVAGVFLAVMSALRLLTSMEVKVYKLICLAAVIVFAAVFFINWQVCKKDK